MPEAAGVDPHPRTMEIYDPVDAARLLEAEGFRIDLREVDDPSSRGHVVIIATRN